jgi:hypothetical protein
MSGKLEAMTAAELFTDGGSAGIRRSTSCKRSRKSVSTLF